MALSDSSWRDFPDTGRITGAYIIFYQDGTIDYVTHFPGPVSQSSAESFQCYFHVSNLIQTFQTD